MEIFLYIGYFCLLVYLVALVHSEIHGYRRYRMLKKEHKDQRLVLKETLPEPQITLNMLREYEAKMVEEENYQEAAYIRDVMLKCARFGIVPTQELINVFDIKYKKQLIDDELPGFGLIKCIYFKPYLVKK